MNERVYHLGRTNNVDPAVHIIHVRIPITADYTGGKEPKPRSIVQLLDSVEGVEVLMGATRYAIRFSIGYLFDELQVLEAVKEALHAANFESIKLNRP